MVRDIDKALEAKPSKQETGIDKNPLNLAASWYVAMYSKDLGKKPKAIELFGQSLVAWRDQNGQPVIIDRYCSHRGTSLAIGQVKDGCIQCPFHHWRYDNSGNCVFIFELDHKTYGSPIFLQGNKLRQNSFAH
jgi:aminopyrrolnitrin oxygenase